MTIPEEYKPWKGYSFELDGKQYKVKLSSVHCVLVENTANGVPTSFRYDELIKAGVIPRKAGYPGYCIDKNDTKIGRRYE